ncbi:bifunctional 2-polyprenyl-6-hydroxyphenol methylase/3-demethylubiquinol 3-O-methyltransferase UbiG [Halococcus sp. IIIV-5B]|uniref:class I SAM-dependent methyltransferase n=1 Tax=Halococcus sp. IIIV-5B TaxID=2321230 RepID=UPI000E73429B|nr:class I SAM-dependent methyltransferase [Halococcus sp. IIIV-5B]RJT04847.1 class I SAM-dependent methyltransferase [Halococcus sp. IIIV-5B]
MDPAENHRCWAGRSGEFSPAYYAHLGPNATSERLAEVCTAAVPEDASILELGCSAGRHLAHLQEAGFSNLAGIDINDESFAAMADGYPDLAAAGTFHTGAIEDVLPEFPDDAFDVVYSVETLQHVPPENTGVFEEVARVTADLLVTVENEGDDSDDHGDVNYVNDDFPLYYRNWKGIFTDLGLVQRFSERTKRDTLRVFEVS